MQSHTQKLMNHTNVYCTHLDQRVWAVKPEEKESGDGSDVVDCVGRPGWDRVDALAKALIKLDGLRVTNT